MSSLFWKHADARFLLFLQYDTMVSFFHYNDHKWKWRKKLIGKNKHLIELEEIERGRKHKQWEASEKLTSKPRMSKGERRTKDEPQAFLLALSQCVHRTSHILFILHLLHSIIPIRLCLQLNHLLNREHLIKFARWTSIPFSP